MPNVTVTLHLMTYAVVAYFDDDGGALLVRTDRKCNEIEVLRSWQWYVTLSTAYPAAYAATTTTPMGTALPLGVVVDSALGIGDSSEPGSVSAP